MTEQQLIAELRAMLDDLDDVSYEMLEHPKADSLCDLIEKLKVWACKASSHNWYYDQCGYWQHQYCGNCGSSKYPDLNKKSCNELRAEMGKMTEEEFLLSEK